MKPLTLILSDSEFLASLELERVRGAWTAKGYTVEETDVADAQAIFYALDTQSLFGDGRFVIIRGTAQQLDPHADRFAAWAGSPSPGVAAAIVAGRSQKLRKALGTRADLREVAAPKPWETADWVVRYVKGLGRSISRDAATALVEHLGTDLRELATAVEQLTLATSGSIGVEVVNKLFRGLESQVYVFLDAILKRDRSAALRHLGALMRAGQHPLAIHATLTRQFRALAAVKGQGRPDASALARELDLTPGHINRASKHARAFDPAEVRAGFRALADADLSLKGGEAGDDRPDALIMELLVADLCQPPAALSPRR